MDVGQGAVLLFWGGLVLVGVLSWFIWDKRYRKDNLGNIPSDYKRTDEVFIDPVEGKKLRVYYNPKTGERLYRND